MLEITIPERNLWDEKYEIFISTKETTLRLEHSLVSLSKWESKYCKPFLDKNTDKSLEETIDYIKCMTLTQNVNPDVYYALTTKNIDEITGYIAAPMTATWFSGRGIASERVVTSELIYYWMIALNIPVEFQKWHLNRLLTLIRVCNEENSPKKEIPREEMLQNRARLNEERRKMFNSKG